ncbi:MAG: cell division protein FtsQ/DivIB [Bacteroidia bacterium]
MKKINYRKILVTVLWIVALSGLMASLAFVSKEEKHTIAKSLSINIHNTEQNQFIDEDDIRNFFYERRDSIVNSELSRIDVNMLEKALNSHPAVENSDISVSVNGDVKVEITQRTPLVRVINMDGESYYIDTKTKLMPLSDNYTARVLVVSGYIFEPYSRRHMFSVEQIGNNATFKEVSILDDIYKMAAYISKDTLLQELVHQVAVNNEKEFELFTAIGNHRVLFGDANDIAEKFEKLKLFYNEGLNKTDNWNKYSMINLKYKNQVVCTKK